MLILNGNGADIAKHCKPAVPKKRYLIFFRINIFYVDSLYNGFSYNLHNLLFLLFSVDRISITFRKMDQKKLSYKYTADPELLHLNPGHRQKLSTG